MGAHHAVVVPGEGDPAGGFGGEEVGRLQEQHQDRRKVYWMLYTSSFPLFYALCFSTVSQCEGAAVRPSQNATGGGPGERPLTVAADRVTGLLSEDALEGIEATFHIGVTLFG